jgi:hypothetical protein
MSNMRRRQSDAESGAELLSEEVSQAEAECFGDPGDVHERDVAQAAFDATDVGSMDASLLGEGFLRPTALVTNMRTRRPKLTSTGLRRTSTRYRLHLMTMGLQTMSNNNITAASPRGLSRRERCSSRFTSLLAGRL